MLLFIHPRVLHGFAFVALLAFSLGLRAEILVVAGANSPLTTLSREQVSVLFLGKVVALPDGSSSTLIDQSGSSPLRDEFYMKVANRSAAQAKALWAKLYFTGRGVPPLQVKDSAEVKKMVCSIPGAIGYIERSSLDPSVKVLYVAP